MGWFTLQTRAILRLQKAKNGYYNQQINYFSYYFLPLGKTKGVVIRNILFQFQQLHIAKGLRRSYNDSGL